MPTKVQAWWGIQTTEAKARQAKNGRHLIKHYEGRYVGTWRFTTPEFAQQAKAHHERTIAAVEAKGLKRPWKLEIV